MGCLVLVVGLASAQSTPSSTSSAPIARVRRINELRVLYEASRRDLVSLLKGSWANSTLFASSQKPFIRGDEWLMHGEAGSIRWDRAISLGTFIELCRPRHMLEVGSFLGLSSNFFLRVMSAWGGRLTSVDSNVRHRVFEAPRAFFHRMNQPYAAQGRVRTFDGFWMSKMSLESGSWDYQHRKPIVSGAALQHIMDGRPVLRPDQISFNETFGEVDMVFIDGAHDEGSVKRDFDAMIPLLSHRNGACVIFDDVDKRAWPGTFKVWRTPTHPQPTASATTHAYGPPTLRFLMMQAVDGIRKRALEEGTGMMYLSGSTALFVDQGYIERRRQALEHATVLGKIQGRLDEMRRSPAKSKISDLKKFLSEARSELDQQGAGRHSAQATRRERGGTGQRQRRGGVRSR